MKERKIFWNIN